MRNEPPHVLLGFAGADEAIRLAIDVEVARALLGNPAGDPEAALGQFLTVLLTR